MATTAEETFAPDAQRSGLPMICGDGTEVCVGASSLFALGSVSDSESDSS